MSPPSFLVRVNYSQETQFILRFLSFSSHQNLIMKDWMRLQKESMILKHVISYDGIDESMTLIRVCLPVPERNRLDHERVFFWILSIISMKMSRFDAWSAQGFLGISLYRLLSLSQMHFSLGFSPPMIFWKERYSPFRRVYTLFQNKFVSFENQFKSFCTSFIRFAKEHLIIRKEEMIDVWAPSRHSQFVSCTSLCAFSHKPEITSMHRINR